MSDESDIWVGRFDVEDGGVVVFDPEIQIAHSDRVYLFSLRSEEILTYYPHHIRRHMKKVAEARHVSQAISTYYRWKIEHAKEFVLQETSEIENRNSELIKKEIERKKQVEEQVELIRLKTAEKYKEHVIEKHKTQLQKIGVEYKGVKISNEKKPRRTTHCYACKSNLDNYFDIECQVCKWIICDCGACGCGYTRSYSE